MVHPLVTAVFKMPEAAEMMRFVLCNRRSRSACMGSLVMIFSHDFSVVIGICWRRPVIQKVLGS